VETFTDKDWEKIAEVIPTKDASKCKKRWLFIQKLKGNKNKWSPKEDSILMELIAHKGAFMWSELAQSLYEGIVDYVNGLSEEERDKKSFVRRNGKQCRERWLTALDPSINKGQWSLQEDLMFLQKWVELGNKWREIAKQINGRNES